MLFAQNWQQLIPSASKCFIWTWHLSDWRWTLSRVQPFYCCDISTFYSVTWQRTSKAWQWAAHKTCVSGRWWAHKGRNLSDFWWRQGMCSLKAVSVHETKMFPWASVPHRKSNWIYRWGPFCVPENLNSAPASIFFWVCCLKSILVVRHIEADKTTVNSQPCLPHLAACFR